MAVAAAGHCNACRLLALVQTILPPCSNITTKCTEHAEHKELPSAGFLVAGAPHGTFFLAGTRRSFCRQLSVHMQIQFTCIMHAGTYICPLSLHPTAQAILQVPANVLCGQSSQCHHACADAYINPRAAHLRQRSSPCKLPASQG
jgi:hypothetical protein